MTTTPTAPHPRKRTNPALAALEHAYQTLLTKVEQFEDQYQCTLDELLDEQATHATIPFRLYLHWRRSTANQQRHQQAQRAEQVEATCFWDDRRDAASESDLLPEWFTQLNPEQREAYRITQQVALDEAEARQQLAQENQQLRQQLAHIAETLDTDIETLLAGEAQPTMIPYRLYQHERERRIQAEQQQDRLFGNPHLKPAQKLGLYYLQRQVERGQHHDREGRTRINATTLAKHMGMSPDTGNRFIEFCKTQLPDLGDWATHPEPGPDGTIIDRHYVKFINQDLLTHPEQIMPAELRKQGGDHYLCPICQSRHVTVKRKTTRTLICNDCKHTVEIDTKESETTYGEEEQQHESDQHTDAPPHLSSHALAAKNFSPQKSKLPDILKPFTPPVGNLQHESASHATLVGEHNHAQPEPFLGTDEWEAVLALYEAIAGTDTTHIRMVSEPCKWKTVNRGVSWSDLRAHIEGRKTVGTRLYHEGGLTRAFLVDADNEEEVARLRAGARKLAAAGFFPVLDTPPAGRPRGVEGYHEVSEHAWIVMDGLVSREAGWAELVRIAPEWGRLKERWPALKDKPVGNRVRLPGGLYVMPGFEGYTTLQSVSSGEYARTGAEQARLVLAQQSPASLIPPAPYTGNRCQQKEQDQPPAVPCVVAKASTSASIGQRPRAGGNRPLPVVDEAWVKKYGPVETTSFYFAVTEAASVAWFNAHHSLESLQRCESDCKALSPNGPERTASAVYWQSPEGERYTDFSRHGLRPDGSHDGGDAFELACKLWKCTKAELSKRTMRQMQRVALAELEAAARAGREPEAWVCALTTPAGWRYYDSLRFKPGDRVLWKQVEAEVVRVGKGKVTIRVQQKKGFYGERQVLPEELAFQQPECPIRVVEAHDGYVIDEDGDYIF